jgi:hypothetical protein
MDDMKKLYYYLERNKLNPKLMIDTIHRLKIRELIDIFEALHIISLSSNQELQYERNSLFNFIANENLSG